MEVPYYIKRSHFNMSGLKFNWWQTIPNKKNLLGHSVSSYETFPFNTLRFFTVDTCQFVEFQDRYKLNELNLPDTIERSVPHLTWVKMRGFALKQMRFSVFFFL